MSSFSGLMYAQAAVSSSHPVVWPLNNTENPRVGGSIPPLATIYSSGFIELCQLTYKLAVWQAYGYRDVEKLYRATSPETVSGSFF